MPVQLVRESVGPGEESVWDYPRPPRIEDSNKHIEIVFNNVKIADTHRAKRVLETSHPPVYYIPSEDVMLAEHFSEAGNRTFCEWKGSASYFTITVGDRSASNAAWTYRNPHPAFREIEGYIAVYPALMDACLVDGQVARPQPGGFYGGWITSDIKGPFKGEPGTGGW
ncbi:MAG: DUF427 domain-containing protein [Chloroflexota bacterium]